jgi:predicted dehydrogenase
VSAPRYRAAVVGCGRIGVLFEMDPTQPRPSSHAGAFAADPRVELAALVDIDPDRLARARAVFPTAAGFTDCVAMLEAVRPAIVAVATPPEAHREVVELCAERGVRAIVCEKPIALDGDEGRRLVDSCARTGALLFVNHTRRFDPAIRRVRDDVADGRIGQVQQATAYYTAGILNTGTHLVDLLRFLLGEPAWVMAVGNERTACPRGDADLDALIEFVSGARAVLQCLDVRDYSIFDVHVYGRTGSLLLTRFGFETEWTGMKERADVQGYRELDREGRIREGQPRSLMQSVTRHVVECLDGTDTPISRGEDGLAALEMVLALRESAARGGARVALRHEAT